MDVAPGETLQELIEKAKAVYGEDAVKEAMKRAFKSAHRRGEVAQQTVAGNDFWPALQAELARLVRPN